MLGLSLAAPTSAAGPGPAAASRLLRLWLRAALQQQPMRVALLGGIAAESCRSIRLGCGAIVRFGSGQCLAGRQVVIAGVYVCDVSVL